jgi:uncharacterized membrane protein YjjB (DUF3815 family)
MGHYIPLRNWMVALGIAIGLAISSAVLGLVQLRWGPWHVVGLINLAAAGVWGIVALVLLCFAIGALRRFCARTACTAECTSLFAALFPLIPVLCVLAALCTIEAGDPGAVWGNTTLYVMLLAALATAAAMLAIAVGVTVRLRSWTLRKAESR